MPHCCYTTSTTSLTDCVTAVVIGHYSLNGPCADHFYFDDTDPRHNYVIVSDYQELVKYIVTHFSPPGGTILDLIGKEGTYITFIELYCTETSYLLQNYRLCFSCCHYLPAKCILHFEEHCRKGQYVFYATQS